MTEPTALCAKCTHTAGEHFAHPKSGEPEDCRKCQCLGFRRRPLVPRRDDNPAKVAELRAIGRNPDMSRIGDSPEEQRAQRSQPQPKRPAVFQFPPKLVQIAKYVLAVAGPSLLILAALPAAVIPAWVVYAAYAVCVIAALITGAAIPSPLGARSMVIHGTAAVTAGGVGGGLLDLAMALPEGMLKSAVYAGSLLLFGLAGLALPAKAPESK